MMQLNNSQKRKNYYKKNIIICTNSTFFQTFNNCHNWIDVATGETIELFFKATKRAKEILNDFKPDIVVGTGGYVSGAMVYEAADTSCT